MSTENFSRLTIEQHFHRHGTTARVVARVISRAKHDLLKIDAGRLGGFFIEACGGDRQIKELENATTQGTLVVATSSHNIVSCHSAHFVGGTGKRNEGLLTRDTVMHFNGIAHGPNRLITRLKGFTHDNRTTLTQFKSRFTSKRRFRCDTNRHDDEIGFEDFAVGIRTNALIARLKATNLRIEF